MVEVMYRVGGEVCWLPGLMYQSAFGCQALHPLCVVSQFLPTLLLSLPVECSANVTGGVPCIPTYIISRVASYSVYMLGAKSVGKHICHAIFIPQTDTRWKYVQSVHLGACTVVFRVGVANNPAVALDLCLYLLIGSMAGGGPFLAKPFAY